MKVFVGLFALLELELQMISTSWQLLNKGKGSYLRVSGFRLGIRRGSGLSRFEPVTVLVGW